MPITTTYNFSAGPSMIPAEVLQIAQQELLNFNGCGASIMEISHRSKIFSEVHEKALYNFRKLLSIPPDYEILFTQGGAIGQNALIPLNLLGKNPRALYAITGSWSYKSYIEAQKYGDITLVCNKKPYLTVPEFNSWNINNTKVENAYLHICTNETIDGIEFLDLPQTKLPIVADMSSHILSRKINIQNYGVIYGGAQKNIGPSGLTFVIVRKDLLNQAMKLCPSAFNWNIIAQNNSMYNTPPTFAIYIAGLVFEWILKQGGVANIEKNNILKASKLYDYIDNSDFYTNNINLKYRSRMNIPFKLNNENLNDEFLNQAGHDHLIGLKGHKSIGGMRASIYNAMPMQGVEKLIEFMQYFAQKFA